MVSNQIVEVGLVVDLLGRDRLANGVADRVVGMRDLMYKIKATLHVSIARRLVITGVSVLKQVPQSRNIGSED